MGVPRSERSEQAGCPPTARAKKITPIERIKEGACAAPPHETTPPRFFAAGRGDRAVFFRKRSERVLKNRTPRLYPRNKPRHAHGCAVSPAQFPFAGLFPTRGGVARHGRRAGRGLGGGAIIKKIKIKKKRGACTNK